MPGMCGFCLRASEYSKTLAQPGYQHFEAKYAAVSSSFSVEIFSAGLELFMVESIIV